MPPAIFNNQQTSELCLRWTPENLKRHHREWKDSLKAWRPNSNRQPIQLSVAANHMPNQILRSDTAGAEPLALQLLLTDLPVSETRISITTTAPISSNSEPVWSPPLPVDRRPSISVTSKLWHLNKEQAFAFHILATDLLLRQQQRSNRLPLLMNILGEPGTGMIFSIFSILLLLFWTTR